MTIRAANELTPDGYAKNYDAVVSVRLESRPLSFALEYERSPKKPRTSWHSNVAGAGTEIRRFLYVVPEPRLASLVLDCFFETTAAVYVGSASSFIQSFAEMKVSEARSGRTTPISTLT
jgi:hypothetical protein